ncbi:MAG: hypothetical protein II949_11580 [Prevotella sp.]|jgi:uncharacterized protein YdeI (BOF family)|nr:hypothetical protein [Prevotella sp.]
MKRSVLFSFIAVITATLFITSCSNKKDNATRAEQIEEFRAELTAQDTLAMLTICDDAMEQLKQQNYDQVLANLFEYNDSTKEIKPLSEFTAKRYQRMFKLFPVLSYMRQYYSFMLEGCNDVKYEVTFADAEHSGTGKPATTMYMFNPVRVNGEWKLCVKTAGDEFDTELQ